jgi:hypothetical protein
LRQKAKQKATKRAAFKNHENHQQNRQKQLPEKLNDNQNLKQLSRGSKNPPFKKLNKSPTIPKIQETQAFPVSLARNNSTQVRFMRCGVP